ncbi:TonB family protein [Terasakiella pusilla]|uniref:energy transducer TonB n=1 Tax=Terasakiella pusilla TaxID=64973 RepID=UPI003AA7C9F5
MLIFDPEEGELGWRGISADLPLSQRLGYGFGAVVLHGVIGAACLIGLKGQGLEMREAVAADEIAIYVETVVPPAVVEQAVAPPAPVPEIEEEVAQPEETSDVEEPPLPVKDDADMVLPRARIKMLAPEAKPTPPQKTLAPQPIQAASVQGRKASLHAHQQAKAESPRGWVKPSYPAYLRNPPPTYPKSARKRRLEGVVHLRVWVSAEGGVQDIKIATSCGHRQLDEAAVKAVRTWRFLPAKRNGVAHAGEVIVPVRFRLK